MTIRCGCPDDENAHVDGGFRDSIVFGACNTCRTARSLGDPPSGGLRGSLLAGTPASTTDGSAERPYEKVLSDVDGDLG